MDYLQRDLCVTSVDDVWGVETWRMNQSELDVEPGSTKDKESIMAPKKKKKGSSLTAGGSNLQVSEFTQTQTLTGSSQRMDAP